MSAQVFYVTKRGAGICRVVHSHDELEKFLGVLLSRGVEAVVRSESGEYMGEVDPDGGDWEQDGNWWFDNGLFPAALKAEGGRQ